MVPIICAFTANPCNQFMLIFVLFHSEELKRQSSGVKISVLSFASASYVRVMTDRKL
jgi:hypothetical protein